MIEQVRPAGLATWLQSVSSGSGRPLVLDVREPWELQTASVKPTEQFDLLAMPMNSIPARLAELDPQRPVACLCHHGGRSQQVAAFLVGQGFSRVANIAGGINAWAAELDSSVPRY